MAITDTTLAVLRDDFSAFMNDDAAQKNSKLTGVVDFSPYRGDNTNYRGTEEVSVQDIAGKHATKNPSNAAFKNRQMNKYRKGIPVRYDEKDIQDMIDGAPIDAVVEQIQRGMAIEFDRIMALEASASVNTGENGGTVLTFAGDGGLTVNATGGLTHAKFLEIVENFGKNNVDFHDGRPVHFLHAAKERTSMLNINELTNADFTRNYNLENTNTPSAYSMNTIMFGENVNADKKVLAESGGVRNCLALKQGVMKVEMEKSGMTIEKEANTWSSYIISVEMRLKVVRKEGELVQLVTTTV